MKIYELFFPKKEESCLFVPVALIAPTNAVNLLG
jgi:hypothetical protein